MKSVPPHRIATILALGCALTPPQPAWSLSKQDEPSTKAVLLARARTLEQRGRLDLAKQDWAQVLQTDPTEAEALAGLVRAARAEGKTADADGYLARLRSAHPNDPELARLQAGGAKGHDASSQAELDEAARLARSGDARGAMVLYRKVYGMNPPQGAPALAYYGTEAATEDGRPHAIAGLRALADRFPADARYRVALGKVLLGSARTRAEGRTILEELPGNPEAVAALHPPQGADEHAAAAAPSAPSRQAETATAASVPHTPIPKAPDTAGTQLATQRAAVTASHAPVVHTTLTTGSSAGHHLTFAVEERAAYSALNQHKTAEAEQLFREILAKNPRDARALAGMGYLRTTNGDYRSAVKLFEQAQESGDRSLALTRAMVNAQFELALQDAASERSRGNLAAAEDRYRAALRERPSDSEALDGLGSILLQEWRPADAIAVYDRLTHVRPMSPSAWRGLVVAEASAGKSAAALATDAQVPTAAKMPLLQDQTYLRAVGVARGSQGTQVARAEAPPALKPSPAAPAKVPIPPPASIAAAPAAPAPQPTERATKIAVPAHGGEAARGHSNKPSAAAVAPAPAPAPAVRAPAAPQPEPPSGVVIPGELAQANAALLHGNNAEAATMFRSIATKAPQRADGWRGLVLALHNEGHEIEALAALERMPSEARAVLDRDASFQSAAGAVYLTTNQPNEALRSYARAQDVFSGQRLPPPLELVLQTARLLAARGDDENLYRELMYLGERMDATDSRRAEVQMIWTRWAVRRARAVAAAGDERRAVTLLNAAAAAFTGNPEVLRAVADGYAGVGRPREAVALYKTQDLNKAPAAAIEAAVSAATAAHDFRTAENWSRLGLQRFGQDPGMLNVAAELAQARGHEKQAVALSQQAKGLAPAQNPGQVLAAELKQANAGGGWAEHPAAGGQLSVLLAPKEAAAMASGVPTPHPYLPTSAEKATGSYAPTAMVEPPVLTGYDEPSR